MLKSQTAGEIPVQAYATGQGYLSSLLSLIIGGNKGHQATSMYEKKGEEIGQPKVKRKLLGEKSPPNFFPVITEVDHR